VGTILGGACGDAFGMPFEAMTSTEIRETYGKPTFYVDSQGPLTKGLKRGSITDDTQMTLATLESMIEKNEVDPEDIGQRFVKLYKNKELIAGGRSTQKALKNILTGVPAEFAGLEDAYGCGASMRAAPVGLLQLQGRHAEMTVAEVTYITHKNPVGLSSSMVMAFAVSSLLGGQIPIETQEQKYTFLMCAKEWASYGFVEPPFSVEHHIQIAMDNLEQNFDTIAVKIGTSGLAAHATTLALTSFLKEPHDFTKMLQQSVRNGGDTDSIAAMAGQLFGAYNGVDAIPPRYIINVKDHKHIKKVAEQFYNTFYESQ